MPYSKSKIKGQKAIAFCMTTVSRSFPSALCTAGCCDGAGSRYAQGPAALGYHPV
jgi:hypothetical protein